MDSERAVLSRVIRDGEYQLVLDAGLTEEHFNDGENLEIYQWLKRHTVKYGQPPGVDALRLNHPTYKLLSANEPMDVYLDQLHRERKHAVLAETVVELTGHLKAGRTDEALDTYLGVNESLTREYNGLSDIDLTLTWQARLTKYREYAKAPGVLRGIPTGFATIDKATRGIQPSQFIVIIGQQKSGKSTVLMKIADTINAIGHKVLVFSFEMDAEEQAARRDAMAARISHGRLLDGRITRSDVLALRKAGQRAEGGYPFIVSTDLSASTTVSWIGAKIADHKPDVVFIDGVYLMDDEYGEPPRTNAALSNISGGLAKLIRRTKVPIIVTTQALASKTNKKEGLTAYSTGYTSAFNQDCHVMLGIEPLTPDTAELKVLLSRAGPRTKAKLRWDWENGAFEEIEFDDDQGYGDKSLYPTDDDGITTASY